MGRTMDVAHRRKNHLLKQAESPVTVQYLHCSANCGDFKRKNGKTTELFANLSLVLSENRRSNVKIGNLKKMRNVSRAF